MLLLLLGCLALTPVAFTMVHEGGHLLANWLVGFPFVRVVIGPLWIERHAHGLRWKFRRRRKGENGHVALAPTDDRDLRIRLMVSVAAGPVATGLATFAAMAVLFRAPSDLTLSPVDIVLVGVVLCGGLSTAFNLFGRGRNGLVTDGDRLRMLWADDSQADRWIALARINPRSTAGQRPRDWDDALIRSAGALRDGSPEEFRAAYLAWQQAWDSHDVAGQADALERLLSAQAPAQRELRAHILAFAAFYSARVACDPLSARAWAALADPASASWSRMLHAVGWAAFSEGDDRGALDWLEQAIALAKGMPASPGRASIVDATEGDRQLVLAASTTPAGQLESVRIHIPPLRVVPRMALDSASTRYWWSQAVDRTVLSAVYSEDDRLRSTTGAQEGSLDACCCANQKLRVRLTAELCRSTQNGTFPGD